MQGFHAFLPQYLKRRKHARRVDVVPAPLFPRYLFVSMDAAVQRWRSIDGTRGVQQLVSQGERPLPIDAAIVEELMARRDLAGFIPLARNSDLRPGDRVQIAGGGVFDAAIGLFEGFADRDRVVVLLELLGRKSRVVLERARVEALA